jgi:hypothetical protein
MEFMNESGAVPFVLAVGMRTRSMYDKKMNILESEMAHSDEKKRYVRSGNKFQGPFRKNTAKIPA